MSKIPRWLRITLIVLLVLVSMTLIGGLIWFFFWQPTPMDEPIIAEETLNQITNDEYLATRIDQSNQEMRYFFEVTYASMSAQELADIPKGFSVIDLPSFGYLALPGEFLPLADAEQSIERLRYQTFDLERQVDFYADIRSDFKQYLNDLVLDLREEEGLFIETSNGIYDKSPTTILTVHYPDQSLRQIYLLDAPMGIKRIDYLFNQSYAGNFEAVGNELLKSYSRFY